MMENNNCFHESLLVCIGNGHRQDDSVGLYVGQQLKQRGLKGVRIMESAGDGAAMIDAWQNEDAVILVDAIRSGQAPGTVVCFDAVANPLPEDIFAVSSHDFSIPESIALSRSLGIFPEKVIFYGIEGEHFGYGDELSPAVKDAANAVAEWIAEDLQA